MYPHDDQPAKLYGTVKSHKFNNIHKIDKEKLKFCPIHLQCSTSNVTVRKTTLQKRIYNK